MKRIEEDYVDAGGDTSTKSEKILSETEQENRENPIKMGAEFDEPFDKVKEFERKVGDLVQRFELKTDGVVKDIQMDAGWKSLLLEIAKDPRWAHISYHEDEEGTMLTFTAPYDVWSEDEEEEDEPEFNFSNPSLYPWGSGDSED